MENIFVGATYWYLGYCLGAAAPKCEKRCHGTYVALISINGTYWYLLRCHQIAFFRNLDATRFQVPNKVPWHLMTSNFLVIHYFTHLPYFLYNSIIPHYNSVPT